MLDFAWLYLSHALFYGRCMDIDSNYIKLNTDIYVIDLINFPQEFCLSTCQEDIT
jgi:hypothetical protein